MTNSVDPDETTSDELSHLDLHCLHRYLAERVKRKTNRRKFVFGAYANNARYRCTFTYRTCGYSTRDSQ